MHFDIVTRNQLHALTLLQLLVHWSITKVWIDLCVVFTADETYTSNVTKKCVKNTF